VDTSCTFWQDDPDVKDVAYTNPVYHNEIMFHVREQHTNADITSIFQMFTPTVWALSVSALLLHICTFALISVAEQRLSGDGRVTASDVADRIWNVIRMQLKTACETPNRQTIETFASKILFLEFNLFQTFLLTSLYSGLLLTFLLSDTNKIPFENGHK
ncbi:hypothetical protein PFISCL1PPCAC_4055, partial [Pristionchus fissidentatus]